MNRRVFLAGGAAALLATGRRSFASNFPAQPIRIMVMYPAGGGADSLNRVIAEKLTKELGQPVIVDNRPGAAGALAARAVLSAAPDGHTLLHAGAPIMTLAPKLVPDTPYKPDDFVPVASYVLTHYLLVARADFAPNTLQELVALAKQKPGELACGNWGPTSITRVTAEMLSQRTGIRLSHIPYRGEAPLTTDLLGGQVPLGWITLPAATEHIKAGKLRAFGVASQSRVALLPEVPTFIEQGLADFNVVGWSGLFAPKGTPGDVIARLHVEVERAKAAPDVAARLRNLGLDSLSLSAEAFGDMVRRENERLAAVLDIVAAEIKK
jgi:tripartite-type tricarboxylate transporter receptor subunit TctC